MVGFTFCVFIAAGVGLMIGKCKILLYLGFLNNLVPVEKVHTYIDGQCS